jgi:hypothetical protein
MITLMKFIMMLFSYHLYHIIVISFFFLPSVKVDLIYIYIKKDESRMTSFDISINHQVCIKPIITLKK